MLRDKLLTMNQKVTITRFDRKIGLTGRHTGLPLRCKGKGGAAYSCTAEFVIFIRERNKPVNLYGSPVLCYLSGKIDLLFTSCNIGGVEKLMSAV